MQNSKLIRYLRSLTPEELRRFELFLRSPFYNTNQKLLKLLRYIGRYHPALTSKRLQKDKLWVFLYPGEDYDDNRLRQRLFLLTQLLETFLRVLELENEEKHQTTLLIEALDKRRLHPYFSKTVGQELELLERKPIKSAATYQQLHRYCQQLYFHPDTPKFQAGGEELRKCIHYLDQYFVLQKLEYACEAASREVLFSEAYPDWWVEQIEGAFEQIVEAEEALLPSFYRELVQLQKQEDNHELFTKIKVLFIERADELPDQQRIAIYQYLSNYAARRVNTGERQYYQELFELTQLALEYHIIVEKDRITDATFTNTVVMASVLKEFEWAEQFMEQYRVRLEDGFFNSATNLSMAYWHYHQQHFAEVLEHLQEIHFLPSYGYRVKSLRTRTLYELYQKDESYLDAILAEISSFEQYIRREKTTTTYRRKSYLHLVRYLKKLIKIKNDPKWSVEKSRQLQEEIKNKQPVFAKHWLLEKVIELRQK